MLRIIYMREILAKMGADMRETVERLLENAENLLSRLVGGLHEHPDAVYDMTRLEQALSGNSGYAS